MLIVQQLRPDVEREVFLRDYSALKAVTGTFELIPDQRKHLLSFSVALVSPKDTETA